MSNLSVNSNGGRSPPPPSVPIRETENGLNGARHPLLGINSGQHQVGILDRYGGVSIPQDAAHAGEADEGEDDDEDIDIQALSDVAKRLDIPLPTLLRQLRKQQMLGDDDGEENEEDATGDDDTSSKGSDIVSPTSPNTRDYGIQGSTSAENDRPNVPSFPPSGDQLRVGSSTPTPTGSGSLPSRGQIKQIRIKGALSDMDDLKGTLTSPVIRIEKRFPVGSVPTSPNGIDALTPSSAPILVGDSITSGTDNISMKSNYQAPQVGSVPNFYDNTTVPAKSALNKKSGGLAKRRESGISGNSAGKVSARRFGKGTKEKMLTRGATALTDGASVVKKAVRFGELEQVHVFEVDNSLYISIEYSRPVIGWVLLIVGVLLKVVQNSMDVYKLAQDPDSAYGFSTGHAIGSAFLCLLIILPVWYFFMKPTKREARFLKSIPGVALVIATGIIFSMANVGQQSASRITDQWRSMATYSLHPAIIVLYGKVFRNSVFYEELIGVGVLAVGYFLAMTPTDIRVDQWYFAEIITFAQSIYISSFLFLAVKSRGNQVSVPVTMASIAFFGLIIQFIVCAISGTPFNSDSEHSAFEFAVKSGYLGWFFATTFCEVISLACCLLALRFIPPLTVSTSWVIEPLLTQLVVSFLFFNERTRVWDVCDPSKYGDNKGLEIFCGNDAFSYWFASGALVAVLATGYIIYVSSIKRSKVEMLIKKLKKRKTPKNPYKSRTSDDSIPGRRYSDQTASRPESIPEKVTLV